MDDRSISDQLSQLFPPQGSATPPPDTEGEAAQRGILIDSLKGIASQTGGDLPTVINQFLGGKGELAEVTRAASASGSTSSVNKVVDLLTKTLKLSPAIARIIAPILLKLAPSIGGQAATQSGEKEKPRRKTKPKTSSTKKETTSKKTGKKTAAKPRKTTAKSTAKKKTPVKSTKKETTTAGKRKTAKREVEVNLE